MNEWYYVELIQAPEPDTSLNEVIRTSPEPDASLNKVIWPNMHLDNWSSQPFFFVVVVVL